MLTKHACPEHAQWLAALIIEGLGVPTWAHIFEARLSPESGVQIFLADVCMLKIQNQNPA